MFLELNIHRQGMGGLVVLERILDVKVARCAQVHQINWLPPWSCRMAVVGANVPWLC